MGAYELWQGAMYCVGVFVTCNAGGMGLRWAASALMKRCAADEAKPDAWKGQSFADMMREVDAHKGDYPPEADETDGGPAPDAERLTPEELAEAYPRSYRQAAAASAAPSETDAA